MPLFCLSTKWVISVRLSRQATPSLGENSISIPYAPVRSSWYTLLMSVIRDADGIDDFGSA